MSRNCLAVAVAMLALAASAPAEPLTFDTPFTPIDAAAQTAAMGAGINVLGYDPVWRDPAKGRFVVEDFQRIRAAGFQTVRIGLHAFDFLNSAGQLNGAWLAKLDGFTKAALDAGLNVILDEHNYEACGKDADDCQVKLIAVWRQLAPHYRNAPNRVMFEILNEPHQALSADRWNSLFAEALAVVRASNPSRNVIVGPGNWNAFDALPMLQLPEADRHLIVTFHYYKPMKFTHQGAFWAGQPTSGIVWGTPLERTVLKQDFDLVKTWSLAHDRPIFLGEFGVFDQAAPAERINWTAAVRTEAVARGFAFAWWQFDGNFVLWQGADRGWNRPLLDALIPPPSVQ